MYSQVEKTNLLNEYIKIFFVVASYWVISIFTVFINKDVLVLDLDAPLFVTWIQCVISTVICFFLSGLSAYIPSLNIPTGNPLQLSTCRKVMPLSLLFTFMIATNNLCLKYVGVAFYYIGRSLTTVFNVSLMYFLLKQKTSLKSILCCAGIVIGFLLGVDQESLTDNFSWKGTLFGILGSLSLAMYSIQTKRTLRYVNDEIWLLSYYNNFYSCILFIPLILINNEISEIVKCEYLFAPWYVATMILSGFCGFAIGYVTALQIKVTSPLTHNISGTAKACAQTVIATQWFNDRRSLLWWFSNGLVLACSAAYTRVRQLEMKKQHTDMKV